MKDRSEMFEKLSDLVKDLKVAMFTTHDADGILRSRPMMVQQIESDGSTWFLTSRSSGIVHSIEGHQQVNLAYASPESSRYVSVSGRATQIHDRDKIHALWSPAYKAWFPKGVEDPDITLLKVQIEAAEYWDTKSSRLITLVAAAKAAITGVRPSFDDETHGKIELH